MAQPTTTTLTTMGAQVLVAWYLFVIPEIAVTVSASKSTATVSASKTTVRVS